MLRAAPAGRRSCERLPKEDYFTDKLLAELNASLVTQPFRGIAIACPYMPNAGRMDHEAKVLDAYASLDRRRRDSQGAQGGPVYADASHTSIDGVSLGGYTGIETFLRKPDTFGAWGCVQGALGSLRIVSYAERLAAVHQQSHKDFHLETSLGDPYHDGTLTLSEALRRKASRTSSSSIPVRTTRPGCRSRERWGCCAGTMLEAAELDFTTVRSSAAPASPPRRAA